MINQIQIDKAKLFLGDCLEVMRTMPDNSVDTIITDPPYGLSFMSKKWDYDVPSIEIWKEALRVLKPGGTALIFGGTRTFHRMAINVEDAGFMLFDTIMWIYGSGFPKAIDVSKQIDKMRRAEREVVGISSNGRDKTNHPSNDYGKYGDFHNLTAPATPESELWNGWKSHLKPAFEPIICARKPNDGTYAQNALKHGVSGLNIDGARIPTTDEGSRNHKGVVYDGVNDGYKRPNKSMHTHKTDWKMKPQGRYPANVILNESAGAMLDEQTGNLHPAGNVNPIKMNDGSGFFGSGKAFKMDYNYGNDSGGASRFFKNIPQDERDYPNRFKYCPKSSKSERNAGCDNLESKEPIKLKQNEATSFIDPKNGKRYEVSGIRKPTKNNHPTCKPLKLMEYLCTLTATPTGGIVLDMFMGSGTTGIACVNTGRDFIGIERESDYMEIAKARIESAVNNKQPDLFDNL